MELEHLTKCINVLCVQYVRMHVGVRKYVCSMCVYTQYIYTSTEHMEYDAQFYEFVCMYYVCAMYQSHKIPTT